MNAQLTLTLSIEAENPNDNSQISFSVEGGSVISAISQLEETLHLISPGAYHPDPLESIESILLNIGVSINTYSSKG
jgi:hypothetical protein